MTWTASAKSGWCAMDLHRPKNGSIQNGYCRLDEVKCGCPCHLGKPVTRKKAWKGNFPSGSDETH